VIYLIAVPLALLLVLSGSAKLVRLESFRLILTETYFIPTPLSRPSAILFPLVEVGTGGLLIVNVGIGLTFAAPLLAATTLVATSAWIRGSSGSCGCFGALKQERLSAKTVGRAVVLSIIATVALIVHSGLFGASISSQETFSDVAAFGLAIIGAVAVLILAGLAVIVLPPILRLR
jgi:hypothetical protein